MINENIWHHRLGHLHLQALKTIIKNYFSLSMHINVSFGNVCVISKHHKPSFKTFHNHIYKSFSLIHSYVGVHILHLKVSYITCCLWIIILGFSYGHKFKVLKHFFSFKTMVQTQFDNKIRILWTNE